MTTLTDLQPQILKYWSILDDEEQSKLSKQIQAIDLNTFYALQNALRESEEFSCDYQPLKKVLFSGSAEASQTGHDLIAQGKVGCLIMAGGMGTRLCFDGPKGMYPITRFRQKSLFQFFSERIAAAGKKYQKILPVGIMTSSTNNEQTRQFFEENQYFGLDPEQVYFFVQEDLPFLDQQGNLFLDSKGHIALGPDGNGDLLHNFYRQKLWEDWKNRGIEYVNVVLIDNPMADPFDPELVGAHAHEKCDIMVKGIQRKDPKEKLGVLIRIHDKIHVVEYSELPQSEMEAVLSDGRLKYSCGNLSLFSVSMDFIEKIKGVSLPLHKAFKALTHLNNQGEPVTPSEPCAWKFEKFIFDIFPHGQVEVKVYPRETCFSPLKNASGPASRDTVMTDLQDFDRRTYEDISGLKAPNHPFELDPQFYYPTEELLKKWKNKPLPDTDYIEP